MRFALMFLLLTATAAQAQEVGDWLVVVAKPGAEIHKGKEVVGKIPRGEVLQVQQIEREWQRVTWNSTKGWLKESDVIPLARAENYFTSVIGRDPSAAEYAHRGNARLKLGNYESAIADFNQSLKLKADQHSILTLRGSAYQAIGEHEKAIADYTKAITLDANYSHAFNNRGNALLARKDYKLAIDDFNQAIQLAPNNAIYYTNRGTAWEATGKLAKAIADHNKAIELDPECQPALLNRARARHVGGEYQAALVNFEAMLKLNPSDDRPYNGIAWLYAVCKDAKFRDGEKAVQYATQACKLTDWKNDNYLDTLAAAYAENKDFEQAIATIEKAIALAPDNVGYQQRRELYQEGKPYRE